MLCCGVRHWDTDNHLPTLTSILQYMQPWVKMTPAAKWHWKLIYRLLSSYIPIQFQNCGFSRFFLFFVKINWHSINYFVPVCIIPNCIYFTKPLENWDLTPYVVSSLFIHTSASGHSYFLLYSYQYTQNSINTCSLTWFAHISQEYQQESYPRLNLSLATYKPCDPPQITPL